MKRLFFGVAVAAIALSASAFTNAKSVGDVVAQTSAGNYEIVNYGVDGTCFTSTERPCAYAITQAGHDAGIEANLPFDNTEITSYLSQPSPYLTLVNSETKLYVKD